jgi:hypothetical protein
LLQRIGELRIVNAALLERIGVDLLDRKMLQNVIKRNKAAPRGAALWAL